MSELHSFSLHAGAATLQGLLRQLREKSDADLGAFWAAHPELEGEDGRDYLAMGQLVCTSIAANLHHQDAAHREGYLRALTDLLCMEAEGVSPSDGWDPIRNTARAFCGEVRNVNGKEAPHG